MLLLHNLTLIENDNQSTNNSYGKSVIDMETEELHNYGRGNNSGTERELQSE